MNRQWEILLAMNSMGEDLLEQAECVRPSRSLWRTLLPLAACLCLVLGLFRVFTRELVQPAAETPRVLAPELQRRSFYILESGSGEDGSGILVSGQGELLLSQEGARAALLTDELTGQWISMLIYRWDPEAQQNRITFCDLNGKPVTELLAYGVACVGDVVIVEEAYSSKLYRRSDGALLQEGLEWIAWDGDRICVRPRDGSTGPVVYDSTGQVLFTLKREQAAMPRVWKEQVWFRTYSFVNHAEKFDYGILDAWGNWAVEPKYTEVLLSGGYFVAEDDLGTAVVDPQTGEERFRLPKTRGTVVEAWENAALVRLPENGWQILDWSGQPLTPAGNSIQILDDEGDGLPEAFLVLQSGSASLYGSDGCLQWNRSGTGFVEGVTSRTVLLSGDEICLIDILSGTVTDQFDRPYTSAIPLRPMMKGISCSTGLIYASWTDETGTVRTDVLWEDGTLALQDVQGYDADLARTGGGSYEGGGVFQVTGGWRHIDGSWLWRDAPEG